MISFIIYEVHIKKGCERGEKRKYERENSCPLVHSLNAHNGWDQAGPKLGTGS